MTTSVGREAAFIGKITAGATHEIRNVLAIIKESAGLVEDLLHLSTQRGSLDHERALRTLARIEAQVARGAEVATHLNGVAHTPDHDVRAVDLGEEVRRVVFHAQRPARRKSQTVCAVDGATPPPFRASPLRVQMAVYTAVEVCLERLGEGATLEVRIVVEEGRPAVRLEPRPVDGPGPGDADGTALVKLKKTLNDLGVSLEGSGNGDELTLLFAPEDGTPAE